MWQVVLLCLVGLVCDVSLSNAEVCGDEFALFYGRRYCEVDKYAMKWKFSVEFRGS